MKNVRSWMLLFGLFAVLAFSALGKAEAYKTIVLPPGVSSVGEEAFSDDAAITAVVIPGGVSIADSAFSGCVNLRSLIILEGADLPFGQIFSQLPIENVYCPPESKAYAYFKDKNVNLFTLGEYRADEHFLTDFRLSGAVITGYTGADASVRIPSRILGMPVIEIGDRAFYENTAVEGVFIPNTVMTIGEKGFFCLPFA